MGTRVIKRSKHGSNALAPQAMERIDLEDEDFSDVSGDPGSAFSLTSAEGKRIPPEGDNTYFYVWAHNSSDPVSGVEFFRRLTPGYEIVTAGPDAPKVRGFELKDGEQIVSADHVLMRCNRALHEKYNRWQAHKTDKNNRRMAAARQSDVNLEEDRFAGQRQRSGLDYKAGLQA
jgi:hypothetical protein